MDTCTYVYIVAICMYMYVFICMYVCIYVCNYMYAYADYGAVYRRKNICFVQADFSVK